MKMHESRFTVVILIDSVVEAGVTSVVGVITQTARRKQAVIDSHPTQPTLAFLCCLSHSPRQYRVFEKDFKARKSNLPYFTDRPISHAVPMWRRTATPKSGVMTSLGKATPHFQ